MLRVTLPVWVLVLLATAGRSVFAQAPPLEAHTPRDSLRAVRRGFDAQFIQPVRLGLSFRLHNSFEGMGLELAHTVLKVPRI